MNFDEQQSVEISTHPSINEINSEVWNSLANPPGKSYNPFVDHHFLAALEESECVTADTGWQPMHIQLKQNGATLGLVPTYLKGNSQGEFVFDAAWASAWYQAGGQYYPKMQISVPFTPVTGPRLLAGNHPHSVDVERQLLDAISQLCHNLALSSSHITFLSQKQWQLASEKTYLQRMDTQFHWKNFGYGSYEDFLAHLSSKRRKTIRRERREIRHAGLEIEWLSGKDLQEHHWDAFFEFYVRTSERKWGHPYLNRLFFSLVSQSMSERIVLMLCKRGNEYIAGALHFLGGDTIFGRNWGCSEHHRFLHFEMCYYQAIEYAISHCLSAAEGGAQGIHKLPRGYTAEQTYSVHYIVDPEFRNAVAQFLSEEKTYVKRDQEILELHSPLKADHTPAVEPVKVSGRVIESKLNSSLTNAIR